MLNGTPFDSTFAAMAQLKSVTSAGKGLVGVILPDTTTSARYTAYDLPYLKQAFTAAGYADTDFKIDNAAGTTTTELALAQADITAGAKVLLVDPIDSNTGKAIQSAAAAAGIPMISYDRATFQGTNTYYVSFDNVQVGNLIGTGFIQCVTDWGVSKPEVFTLDGGQDTDPNAIDFAKGYNDAIWGQAVPQVQAGATNSEGATLVGEQIAPGWNNAQGGVDLPAGLHRALEHQCDGRGQRRSRRRRDRRPQGGRRSGQEDPDHRPGRDAPGDGVRAPELAVRLGLQADLPRGPGGSCARDVPARGPARPDRPRQRHHHRPGEPGATAARRPADAGLGERRPTWNRRSSRTRPSRRRTSAMPSAPASARRPASSNSSDVTPSARVDPVRALDSTAPHRGSP